MSQGAGFRPSGLLSRRSLLMGALGFQALAIVAVIVPERSAQRAEEARMLYNLRPGVVWRPNPAKSTILPPAFKASEATLDPGDLVVGVQLGDAVRAYRVAAFDDSSGHLVIDRVGGVPVSVAYCNITRCVRVYAGPQGTELLDAEVTGLLNQRMVIRFGENVYFHNNGEPVEPEKKPPPIPYPTLTHTIATWKAWREIHPDTDVFVGRR